MRRLLGPLLLILLVLGVGYGIYRSTSTSLSNRRAVEVRGLVGSEKLTFLTDPRVLAELHKHGIDLKVEKSGSREMAARPDLNKYDFAFPAGAPAATKIMQQTGAKKFYNPFFSPMAIATWRPIVAVLTANGLATRTADSTTVLDVHKMLAMMKKGTRWKDLAQNNAYPIGKTILINTTDIRTSNSAAMYLALMSYVANGDNVVQTDQAVQRVAPVIAPLFSRQGYQESSTAGPFEDYLTMGMGKSPLVMIYEQQFIEHVMEHAALNPDMVLLYPSPGIYTKHTLIPLNAKGDSLGRLLEEDPVLLQLANEFGLRTQDAAYAAKIWTAKGLKVPAQLLDVIDPPNYDIIEQLITAITKGAGCANADSTCS